MGDHMTKKEKISECLLCRMQHNRCKMEISNKVYAKFIGDYQEDSNAHKVEAKLNDEETWNDQELKGLLSHSVDIDYDEYKDDGYHENKMKESKQNKQYGIHSKLYHDHNTYNKHKQHQYRNNNNNYNRYQHHEYHTNNRYKQNRNNY